MQYEIEGDVLKKCSMEWYEKDKAFLSDRIKVIGNLAFANLSGLTGITLPDGLEKIGACAFINCNHLTKIRIPPGVHTIGDGVFSDCEKLAHIIVPDSVNNCGKNVLDNCRHLHKITIYRQDFSAFQFSVHSRYASQKLQLLLKLPFPGRIAPSQLSFLYRQMVESGYDTSDQTIEILFRQTVEASADLKKYEKAFPGKYVKALQPLQKLLSDEAKMKKVHPQCWDDMIALVNERQCYDIQLLLMDAAKKYVSRDVTECFQL